jgi:hypothetical protein
MTLNQVIRVFALIGIIGAIVQIGSITYAYIGHEMHVTNIINALAFSLIFFGLISSYLVQVQNLGRFGLISMIVLFIGFVLVCGLVWTLAFARPVIELLDPSLAANNAILPSPLLEGTVFTFLTYNLGMLLYGISNLKSGKIARWAGLLFIIGVISNFITPQDDKALYFFNIAIIWICWKVWARDSIIVSNTING